MKKSRQNKGITMKQIKTLVANVIYEFEQFLILSQCFQKSFICGKDIILDYFPRFEIKFRENGDYWLFFTNDTGTCPPKIANDPAAAEMRE